MSVQKQSYANDLVLRAARGETTPRTPVWLMRQAGRCDPEYNRIREQTPLPLEDLFRHPELAAKISLLPKRWGVDAIIIFQDILTPLAPMGAPFLFRPGPQLEVPVRTQAHVDALAFYEMKEGLPHVAETFSRIHDQLSGELPVLGFAGAPLTLAVFLIEGRSFGESASATMRFLEESPELAHGLLDKLTRLTVDYLKFQVECGAAMLQLFESAAHLFSRKQYETFALPYQQRIFAALKGVAPTILFARNRSELDLLDAPGADVISLPSAISIAQAREVLGPDRPIQGNLDNQLLAHGNLNDILAAARQCIHEGRRHAHIFNLSHGLLPETPLDAIQQLICTAHETT